MDAIAAAALALFDDPNLGQEAAYTPPAGGPPVALRLRLTRPAADPFGGDSGGARTAAAIAHVAAAALPERPARGGLLVVGTTTYKVAQVEADPAGGLLRLVLARG